MAVLPLKVFSLKRSTAGAFAVLFRLLIQENMTEDTCNVLHVHENWFLLGEKKV